MCRAVLKNTNQVQGGIEGVLVFAGHHPDYNGVKKGGREQQLYLKTVSNEFVPLECIHGVLADQRDFAKYQTMFEYSADQTAQPITTKKKRSGLMTGRRAGEPSDDEYYTPRRLWEVISSFVPNTTHRG
jgi:hypothetical protein